MFDKLHMGEDIVQEEVSKVEYEIVDFNGEIPWVRIRNNTYAVDPLYEEKFNNTKTK
jgi:hypothetical protein